MSVADFAAQYKLKTRRHPDDGVDVIQGSHDQSHIYEWDDAELAVIFITPASKPARPFFWHKHRDAGIATLTRFKFSPRQVA